MPLVNRVTASPSSSSAATAPSAPDTMTRQELRSSGSLALIFALRMLGLFLVLLCLRWRRSIMQAATTRPWWAWPWACTA